MPPGPLRRAIAFARAEQADTGRVHLAQTGEMIRERGAEPMPFTARQWIDPDRPQFHWTARFRFGPFTSLVVEDQLEDGEGLLRGRVGGWLPLFRSAGDDVTFGELYRYLAEIPWAPRAYLDNEALSFHRLDAERFRVECTLGGRTARLDVTVDEDGRWVEARAPDRPREVDGVSVATEWVGRYAAWEVHDKVCVPTRGQVAWVLDDTPFVYWRGEVTAYGADAAEP